MSHDLKSRLYISTVCNNGVETARKNGLGLELAEFCMASNMDADFERIDVSVRREMDGISRFVFHAPFNEIHPAAIDPLALELAKKRYEQTYSLMRRYGINRMVVHSGFVPRIYFESWQIERSVIFWSEFLRDKPDDFVIAMENVMESSPDMLVSIVSQVDDPRLRLCFDTGHANVTSPGPEMWIEAMAPYLIHAHIHNNAGVNDTHDMVGKGSINMKSVLDRFIEVSPQATITVEALDCEGSILWLKENGFIN